MPIWWESPHLAILGEGTTRAIVDGLPALLRFPVMLGLCLIRSFPVAIGIGLYLVIGCGFARVRSRVQAFDWMVVSLVLCCVAAFVLFPVQKEVMWNVVGPGFSLINALLFALMGPAVCSLLRWPYRHGRVVATVTTVLLLLVVALFGVYTAVGRADVEGTSRLYVLSWHAGVAVFALIALRIGVQLAVLHQEVPPSAGDPYLCLPCRQVVPEMTFCPSCGTSHLTVPSRSRAERSRVTPEDVAHQPDSRTPPP